MNGVNRSSRSHLETLISCLLALVLLVLPLLLHVNENLSALEGGHVFLLLPGEVLVEGELALAHVDP